MRRSHRQWLITWRWWHKTRLNQGTGFLGTEQGESQILVSDRFCILIHINLLYQCWRAHVTLKPTDLAQKQQCWGCEHEKDALRAYKTQIIACHSGLNVTSCGFFICVEYTILCASPDALIEYNCCGQGVVEVKCSLCAQESSLEETADAVESFCLDVHPTGKFQLKRNHPYYFQVQLQMFASVVTVILMFEQLKSYTKCACWQTSSTTWKWLRNVGNVTGNHPLGSL